MSNGLPTDPVQALLAQASLQRTLFSATSRYYGLDTDTMQLPGGTTIIYLQRRFLPKPQLFQTMQEHTIVQGDRLDNLAAKFLGEPTLFWRLADANSAMRPEELTETFGRILNVTLPEGIRGARL
jgi:hypothetical protein